MGLDRSRAGRHNLLLASLPAKDFAVLAPHLKDIELEQGAVLQERGERIEQVYFPREGIVSLLAVMRQGEAIETATVGFEGAVGTFAGFGSRRAHTRAVVQVKGWASRIVASRFRKIAEENEAVCRIIVRYGEMLLIGKASRRGRANATRPFGGTSKKSPRQLRGSRQRYPCRRHGRASSGPCLQRAGLAHLATRPA